MQCINDFRSFRNPLGELWFISGQALLVLAHGSPDLLLMDLYRRLRGGVARNCFRGNCT